MIVEMADHGFDGGATAHLEWNGLPVSGVAGATLEPT
jgi:hypothetical protein